MTDTSLPNYPDILGYVTGGPRLNVNVVQLALAARPRVIRAGRPFEAIVLIQNVSDVDVDLAAVLQLPETDAKKKPRKFFTNSDHLVVGLRPAEVGYLMLHVGTMPDTAVGDGYKLGVAVEVKPLSKPRRIRLPEGGGEVETQYLSESCLTALDDLKKLTYSVSKRGLVGVVLELPFSVMSGQIGQLADLKPGWFSLWKLSDLYKNERLLLDRYGDILTGKVMPQLKRQKLFQPLYHTTQQRFKAAGYDIYPAEAFYITKLLLTVLEMGATKEETPDYLSDAFFTVALRVKKGFAPGEAVSLPHWCRGMLAAIDRNEQVADRPHALLTASLYDDLLRDAARLSFRALKVVTGEDIGTDDDVKDYTDHLLEMIHKPDSALDFGRVYLPLVLGGVVFYDRAVLQDEKIGEKLGEIADTLRDHQPEVNADNEQIYHMAEQVIERTQQQFGYRT